MLISWNIKCGERTSFVSHTLSPVYKQQVQKEPIHVTCDNTPPPALGRAVRGSGRGAGAGRHPSWAEQLCATITYCRVEPGFCWGFLSILTMNFNQSHVTSIDKRGSNNWWVARCLILHWESSTAPNGLVEKEPQVMIEFIVLKF